MLEILGIGLAALIMHFIMAEPKELVILLDDAGKVGAVTVSSGDQTVRLDQAGQATRFDNSNPPKQTETLSASRIEGLFAGALGAEPVRPARFRLYFKLDSNDLTEQSSQELPRILEALKNRPVPQITIIGHTDTMGAASYNKQLGLLRAQIIFDAIAASGVDPTRMRIESHGEANLLVQTPDNKAEPLNRRVEVSVR